MLKKYWVFLKNSAVNNKEEDSSMNIENRHISVWGDSILKGIVRDDTTQGYRVLERNCVNRFAESTGSTVSNHASFGMTARKAFERICRSVLRTPPLENDIVLIEFGGNDCDFKWNEISETPDMAHDPKTPLAVFSTTLQSIVDAFKSFKISPILMSLPPLEPNRYFEWVSRGLNGKNILKWLDDVNKIYRWQEVYNDAIVDIARKNDLNLIDVRKGFLISDRYTSLICDDGIHPNERGHETIYTTFMDFLKAV